MRHSRFISVALLVASTAFLAAPAAWAQPWRIAPVHVVDPLSGEIASEQAVQVDGGRIVAVTSAETPAAPGVREIDGANGWLIPGLAEMHAHVPPRAQGEQRVDDVLTLFLAAGVTTIRGMLGEPWHLELRDELADGRRLGPRLITSGPSFNGNTVTAPAQGAKRAQEQAEAGYDFLKIHPGLSREEFVAIARAARDAGVPVAGHVSFETGLETALEWRQASIDHLDAYAEALVPPSSDLFETPPEFFGINLAGELDPSGIRELARQTAAAGVWNVPTQSLFEGTLGPASLEELRRRPGMDLLSADTLARWEGAVEDLRGRIDEADRREFLATRRALIGALQNAGAGLLLGSDAPQIMNVPGYSVHQELQHLVASGLTPLEALRTGTVNVARFFGEDDRGRVAPGMAADFVLLGANPLEDIGNTAIVRGVARDGRWLDQAELDRLREDVRGRGL